MKINFYKAFASILFLSISALASIWSAQACDTGYNGLSFVLGFGAAVLFLAFCVSLASSFE